MEIKKQQKKLKRLVLYDLDQLQTLTEKGSSIMGGGLGGAIALVIDGELVAGGTPRVILGGLAGEISIIRTGAGQDSL